MLACLPSTAGFSLRTSRHGTAWRAGVGLALIGAGVATQAAAARHPAAVETLYSRALYPRLAGVLGCLTGWLPFSLGEAGLAGLGLCLALLLLRLAREVGRRRAVPWGEIGRLLGGGLIGAGVIYLAFLFLWGLNYQREPFGRTAGLETGPAPLAELRALGHELAEGANELREGLAEDEGGVMRLPDGTAGARLRTEAGFRRLADLYPVLRGSCSRVKPVLASPLLARLGISGIYSPFTGEPNLNTTLPDPEVPFSASHEMAHQRGFAREDEANYLGYLACRLHPDPDFRYSGVLAASLYALDELRRADREAATLLEALRSPAVRRDIDALAAWAARYRGPLGRASARVNDAYLKTQGQREGARSYGRMVDLLLAERRARSRPSP
jgi:hypothetical protein